VRLYVRAGSIHEDPGHDAHRHQFLEQQLTRVRDVHLTEACLVVTVATVEELLTQVSDSDHAAVVTDVHAVGVTTK
jgi:hypothetical protein